MGGTRQNFGLSARLQVGSIDVILISHNGQLLDLAQLTSLGVDVARKDLIVCKSKYSCYAFISPSPFPLFLPLSLYFIHSPPSNSLSLYNFPAITSARVWDLWSAVRAAPTSSLWTAAG
jgi:hypothetical protein